MSKQKSTLAGNSATAPPGAVRMCGAARRDDIVRVSIKLFSQRGFRGTTTKEIAQAAGISEAMVFRHFATKRELYTAILDYKACAAALNDPREVFADAVSRKDDRAVFEGIACEALNHHEKDTDFNRLLLHSALEGHELSQMFWERTVLQIYQFLGSYIRERQRDGAFRNMDPVIVVRAFMGMIIHHSLNNNLWDVKRRLLDISNEQAAREFTEIIMRGISATSPASRAATNGRAAYATRAPKKRQGK